MKKSKAKESNRGQKHKNNNNFHLNVRLGLAEEGGRQPEH
jgi:hypothetical protein